MPAQPMPKAPESRPNRYAWDTPSFPLRDQYQRLILISHPRHAENLAPDANALIVSSDWLLWKRLMSDGVHCIHYEWGWDYPADGELNSDLYLRAIDWVFAGGEDATEFRGVSLGQLLVIPVSRVIREYEKLNRFLKDFTALDIIPGFLRKFWETREETAGQPPPYP